MRILIVGGAGYVGGVLTHSLLNQKYNVRVMDNMHKGNVDSLIPLCRNPLFEFQEGDVTDRVACKRAVSDCDAILNLSAIVGSPACQRNPTLSEAVNVSGVENLLSVRSKSQRIVFCSSEVVYGSSECVETSTPAPTSLYASQKLRAETLVANTDNSLSFRFAAGMGLGYSTRINLLVNNLVYDAVKNHVLVIYQGEVLRNFISVQDMARALEFGMTQTQLCHKVYNCGSLSWSKSALAEYIKSKTGSAVFYGDISKDMDNRSQKLNVDRLTKAGFTCRYGMEETIDELIKGVKMINVRHQYD